MDSSRRSTITPLHTTSSLTALPERVTELFSMLDGEHFFRSPFIRHKIVVPNLLFTNGTTGLDPIFTKESPSSSSADSSHSPVPSMHNPAPTTRQHPSDAVVFRTGEGLSDGGLVRNIPIRVIDNKASGNNHNSSSTTINFTPAQSSKPLSLLKNVLQHRNPSEGEDSDSTSLRSAPPELWNRQEEDSNKVSFDEDGDLMARRKLSTPRDLPSHASVLSPRGSQQQNTLSPHISVNSHGPVSRQLSEELNGNQQPSVQRRFFWQPQRQQQTEAKSGGINQENLSREKRLEEAKENERNFNASTQVNYRSVPIVHLNSFKRQENTFGNGVRLDYNSNNNNDTVWQPQQRSSTPAGETKESKAYYSAIPFRRPPSTSNEESNRLGQHPITSAISTPSLLASGNQKPAVSFVKRQKTPSKRAYYQSNEAEKVEQQAAAPSFLRRTQTAYSIPSGNLPRRDSEPSVVIASNDTYYPNHISAPSDVHSNRRSMHETSLQQSPGVPTPHPPSRSKSPSMASLRESLKSFSSKPKKITFVPSCVRGNQPSSDEEEERSKLKQEARLTRSRSPSLTASSLRLTEFVPSDQHSAAFEPKHGKEDSVEEAIRSLESFDPNDYYKQKNEKDYPINTSFYRQQPQCISSDEESLPPPPALPSLNSRFTAAAATQPTSRIQERQWGTPSTAHSTEHFKPRDSELSTLTSSSTTSSSPDSTTSSLQDIQQPAPNVWQPNNSPKEQSYRPVQTPNNYSSNTSGVTFRRPSASSSTPTNTTHSSGSATPTGPQSTTADLLPFNRSFENRTPRPTTPTSAAMGNSNGVVYIGPPHRNLSSQPAQPSHNKSNVPFEMDQLLSRLKHNRGNAQSPNNAQSAMAPAYCSPDYEDNEEDDIEAAAEAEAHLRKRFLCTQLTDCAKVVEINAHKMSQFAAAAGGGGGWRQAHILRHNLAAIRDTVYTIEFALEELLEALARISLERNDSKSTEFHQLSTPLYTSQSLIRRLRSNLDGTGWSLQSLARQTIAPAGVNDALDQFVAILRQLPRDCYKIVQWVYLLGVWNNGGMGPAVFLSTSTHAHSHSVPPPPAPQPYLNTPLNARYSTSSSTSNESPRNSLPPPAKLLATNRPAPAKPPPKVNFQQKQQQTKPNAPPKLTETVLQAPTMAEINMDGGESTTSSNTSSLNMEDIVVGTQQNKDANQTSPKAASPVPKKISTRTEEPEEVSKVYEEDDLMSVASESIDSLYGDYSLVEGNQSRPGSASSGNGARPQQKILAANNGVNSPRETRRSQPKGVSAAQLELVKGLGEDEKELMKFYQPQVEANTAELCRLVDEFFTIVEEHQAAKSFVQKIQMICIKTQTLVCIARMVTKDDITAVSKKLHEFLAKEANNLDGLLNECVSSARIAKDKSQSVAAVQQMVSSVMAVSQAALNLKLFWKSC